MIPTKFRFIWPSSFGGGKKNKKSANQKQELPVAAMFVNTGNSCNRQTSGESASLPKSLGCNTVFDIRLRVTFLRRKTVSLQSSIAHSAIGTTFGNLQ
jgi:hypothetical protein